MTEKPACVTALLSTPSCDSLGEAREELATRRGWVQCARLLLTYGANPHPMATDGHPLVVSPLHLARQMHQTAIEKDILTRAISMENIMLQVVKATLPKHIFLVEPGHLVDTKTSSFFPVQLISEDELARFVLYFKTPPGYCKVELDTRMVKSLIGSEDQDSRPFHLASTVPDVVAPSLFNSKGGLNTLSLEIPSRRKPKYSVDVHPEGSQYSSISSPQPMALIGAYRVRIDVTSLIQTSAGLTFGTSSKPTIYIPRTAT
ncbi:hypothetical protein AHF37_04871 [Paragonimus kellicotti]|nr:hypothetical protein AHF37_04871 [Paragonimus kellicotti]